MFAIPTSATRTLCARIHLALAIPARAFTTVQIRTRLDVCQEHLGIERSIRVQLWVEKPLQRLTQPPRDRLNPIDPTLGSASWPRRMNDFMLPPWPGAATEIDAENALPLSSGFCPCQPLPHCRAVVRGKMEGERTLPEVLLVDQCRIFFCQPGGKRGRDAESGLVAERDVVP